MKAITEPGRVIDVRPWENDGEPLLYGDGTPVLHALVLFSDEANLRLLTLDRSAEWELEVGGTYRFEVSVFTEQVNGPIRPRSKTKVRALRAAKVGADGG